MKKIICLLVFLNINIFAIGQDTIVLKHTNYTSHYSKSKKHPVLVEWWETKKKVNCKNPLPRTDKFKPDPLLPKETNLINDYVGSGFDRGHMMPAKSNQCQTQLILDECFYFSNIAPQTHRLNAGDWKSLEMLTRNLASEFDSVHVWAGSLGVLKNMSSVIVPKEYWKVVHIKKTNKWFFFLFKNDDSKPDGTDNNQVSKEYIEKITGLKFN
jgi:endonuclease G